MYKATLHFELVESTSECVELLNKHHRPAKWKRKSKFHAFKSDYSFSFPWVARVFTDGSENVTIISTEEETIIYRDMDLGVHKALIEEVRKRAKNLYTHDYGEIFFNPYTMALYIVGGDGGMIYNEKGKAWVKKALEEGTVELWDDPSELPDFSDLSIKKCEYEAECFPEIYDMEKDRFTEADSYVLIARACDPEDEF